MAQSEKTIQYAAILLAKVGEVMEEDGEISGEELGDGDNLTHFFHALANIMPTHVFNSITGDSKNNLEFNHIANQLVFQYSKKE
jgi:hypothetical protein